MRPLLPIIAACFIWGMSPLYYAMLDHIPAFELFLHRSVWSMVIFAALLAVQGRLGAMAGAFATRRAVGLTLFCAIMIAVNWSMLIWAVQAGRATEMSLGYYIFPLVAVALGTLFLGERLRALQWVAVGLACVAVVVLTVGLGAWPWLPLLVAVTFALYGLVKKGLTLGPVVSVTAESLVLAIPAVMWLGVIHAQGGGVFGRDLAESAALVFSGVLTALPLILFSKSAQNVPYSTLGLVQYLNPTLQFLCAVLILSEPFTIIHATTFGLIWVALALFSGVAIAQDRARRKASMAASTHEAV